MKKYCAMIVTAVLCFGLLAGCGNQSGSGESGKLTAASVGFDVEAYQRAKDKAVQLITESTAKYNSHPEIFSSSYDFSEHDLEKKSTSVYFSTDLGSINVSLLNKSLKVEYLNVSSDEKDKDYLEKMFTHWCEVLGVKTKGSFDELAEKPYFDASGYSISINLDLGYFTIHMN